MCVLLWTPMFAHVFLYSVKTEVSQWTDHHIFMTTPPERSASRPGRSSAPGKGPPLPIVQEAGWAPEPVWTQRL
jgi:hypothetical protein